LEPSDELLAIDCSAELIEAAWEKAKFVKVMILIEIAI
jgi:hypothetical protein